jgi:hypothetical protein
MIATATANMNDFVTIVVVEVDKSLKSSMFVLLLFIDDFIMFSCLVFVQLQCRNCGYSSKSSERIIALNLHIKNMTTIQGAWNFSQW